MCAVPDPILSLYKTLKYNINICSKLYLITVNNLEKKLYMSTNIFLTS